MKIWVGTLKAVVGDTATIVLPGAGRSRTSTVVVNVARAARVTRNGDRSKLCDLQPGDDVEVKDVSGLATEVRARRH